jgi:hypothetical protein
MDIVRTLPSNGSVFDNSFDDLVCRFPETSNKLVVLSLMVRIPHPLKIPGASPVSRISLPYLLSELVLSCPTGRENKSIGTCEIERQLNFPAGEAPPTIHAFDFEAMLSGAKFTGLIPWNRVFESEWARMALEFESFEYCIHTSPLPPLISSP